MSGPSWCAALLALAVALTDGGEGGQIVVVAEEDLAPLARRVGAELQTRGYEVLYLEREGPEQTLEVHRQATSSDAALELLDGGRRTRLWFVDRELRQGTERLVELDAFDERTMALKVAEVLRAHLLVLPEGAKGQPQGAESPPLAVTAPEPAVDAAPPGWRFSAAYGLGRGFQGARWGSLLRLGAARRLGGGVHLGLEAQLPLGAGHLESAEGTTDLRALALDVRLDGELGRAALRPFATVGLGMSRVRAVGRANAGFEGSADTAWSGTAGLGAGGRLFFGQTWALEASVSAAVWLPRTAVRIAGRRAAELGAPTALASVGVLYGGW